VVGRSSANASAPEGGPMAMIIFTMVNGLGVVFLLYVLVQFWKEGHRTKTPAARDRVIDFEREKRPTVFVLTHGISDRLHASLEAFSIKAEPAPHSVDTTDETSIKRFSTR
jgi:hypothetical protein